MGSRYAAFSNHIILLFYRQVAATRHIFNELITSPTGIPQRQIIFKYFSRWDPSALMLTGPHLLFFDIENSLVGDPSEKINHNKSSRTCGTIKISVPSL
ncbi:MAG: hypothetical protein ACXWCG_02440 [Flavitalea sp.]